MRTKEIDLSELIYVEKTDENARFENDAGEFIGLVALAIGMSSSPSTLMRLIFDRFRKRHGRLLLGSLNHGKQPHRD